jgi:hypothetical protein
VFKAARRSCAGLVKAMFNEVNDIQVSEPKVVESIAVQLAPEDIRVGDFITPLYDLDQFMMKNCDQPPFGSADVPPKVHVIVVRTFANYPQLYRVLAVALPVVLVEDLSGEKSLVSVRAKQFGRLPAALGKIAMRELDRRRRTEAAKRRKAAAKRKARLEANRGGADGAD